MIEIEGPDGVIYEFPAGTDDNTIRGALMRVYGGQQPQQEAPTPEPGFLRQGLMDFARMGQIPHDFVLGGDSPEGRAGGQVGSWLNRAGESMTLGVAGDEAAAGADALIGRGGGYDERLQHYRQQEEDLGAGGRLTADLAGALVPGAGAASLIGRAASLSGRIGRGLLAGGASGATYGFMEGEGGADDRVNNAATSGILGAVLGGAIPAVGAGVRSVAKSRATSKAIRDAAKAAPSSEALRAEGNALYRQIDDAGVQIKPEAFDQMRSGLLDRLRGNTGFDELPGPGSLTPNTARVVNIMDEASGRMAQDPTAALPFRSLDQMRRQAGAAAGNVTNKSDQRAGVEVIQVLDDFVQRLGPNDVIEGSDVKTLQSAVGKAREVWSRMSRSQLVDDAIDRSENYLGGGASGIRNQFKNLLQNKKLSKGFTSAEKAALRSVINGGALERLVTLAGGGLGQLGSIGAGAAVGGLPGGILGAAAATGQRKLAESMAMKSAEQARAAIASGALRDPGLMERLALSGQVPERIANTGLFGALTALQGR
ncbi:MAG: hypothetical protein ACK4NW_01970 [Roseinatronobacter sp.]